MDFQAASYCVVALLASFGAYRLLQALLLNLQTGAESALPRWLLALTYAVLAEQSRPTAFAAVCPPLIAHTPPSLYSQTVVILKPADSIMRNACAGGFHQLRPFLHATSSSSSNPCDEAASTGRSPLRPAAQATQSQIQGDFPQLQGQVCLDHAGSTLASARQLAAVMQVSHLSCSLSMSAARTTSACKSSANPSWP